MKRADLCANTKPTLDHQPSYERMTIMSMHSSAMALEETPHETETITITISDALKRRAQAVIKDRSIDPQWRKLVRYALETNDPWLAELVRRTEAGEMNIDSIDFSQTPETFGDD
jgi:hypothetical protein